jgi:general secretion pathway protein E
MSCSACAGKGCSTCGDSGYSGRAGIYELMTTNEKIRELIHQQASETEIRKQALEGGMRTLADDGKRWVLDGKTTPEEILRVTGSVDID